MSELSTNDDRPQPEPPVTWRQNLGLLGRCALGFFAGIVVCFAVFFFEVRAERGRAIQRDLSSDEYELLTYAVAGMLFWGIAWGLRSGLLQRCLKDNTSRITEVLEDERRETGGGPPELLEIPDRALTSVGTGTMLRAAWRGALWTNIAIFPIAFIANQVGRAILLHRERRET
jgi:hypothetical protein